MIQSDEPTSNTPVPDVPPPTFSWALEQYCHERLENVRRQLPSACRQLREAGISSVYVEYDGSGDSGQIENIVYRDSDGRQVDISSKVEITSDALMDLFYDLTEARHPGWENNDGAYGDFEWDLVADTLVHTHNDRFTDYNTTEHEGL